MSAIGELIDMQNDLSTVEKNNLMVQTLPRDRSRSMRAKIDTWKKGPTTSIILGSRERPEAFNTCRDVYL